MNPKIFFQLEEHAHARGIFFFFFSPFITFCSCLMHEYSLAYFCYYVLFLIYYYHAWICCYVTRLFFNMWLFIVILFLKFQNLQCLTNFLWNLKTDLNFLDLIFSLIQKTDMYYSNMFFNIKQICILMKIQI